MVNIVLRKSLSGDWQGLYIDGKLVEENHKISAEDIFSYIDKTLVNFTTECEPEPEFDNGDEHDSTWFFPETLE